MEKTPKDVWNIIAKHLTTTQLGLARLSCSFFSAKFSDAYDLRILDSLYIHSISSGSYHNLLLTRNGRLLVCGGNSFGQLGLGHENDVYEWTEVVALRNKVRAVYASGHHSVALTVDGRLLACGSNCYGEFCIDNKENYNTWTEVTSLPGVIAEVFLGPSNIFIITIDGRVFCAGWNKDGQLGLGDNHNRNKWVEVELFRSKVKSMSLGANHSILLTKENQVYCCGDNCHYQLGIEKIEESRVWKELSHLPPNIITVAAGCEHSAMSFDTNHLMVCGKNRSGQLGNGSNKNSTKLKKMKLHLKLVSIATAHHHTLAITDKGTLLACGLNHCGQLGKGDRKNRYAWTRISSIEEKIMAISTGSNHSMAITQDGKLLVSGDNSVGQLGLGKLEKPNIKPEFEKHRRSFVEVPTLNGWKFYRTGNCTLESCGCDGFGELDLGNESESCHWRAVPSIGQTAIESYLNVRASGIK